MPISPPIVLESQSFVEQERPSAGTRAWKTSMAAEKALAAPVTSSGRRTATVASSAGTMKSTTLAASSTRPGVGSVQATSQRW